MKYLVYVALATAAVAAPTAAMAFRGNAPAEAPLDHTMRINNTIDQPLASGCRYHANIDGTVAPVPERRGETAAQQRLRPDLRVAATVRCPGSTEAHVQERAVRSTGVTRDEFEHLVSLNASVQRMQNTGRCIYFPEVRFDRDGLTAHHVRYLCPSSDDSARGGGP